MGAEIVTVEVGGLPYTAWEKVSVTAAFNHAARSFEITLAAELGQDETAQLFASGTAVKISSNGDLLVTGYVDSYKPRLSSKQASITISGRSKSADLVDSSAEHKTKHIENKDPVEIGKAIAAQLGVDIRTDRQLDKIPVFRVTPGETVFRALEKACRPQGKTLTGDPDGSLRITDASQAKKHSGGLVQGRNIEDCEATHDWSNRHSHVKVHGQKRNKHGKDALHIEAVAQDEAVQRYRPLILAKDDDIDEDRAKTHAENRRDRAAGKSLTCSITPQGFRDEGGKLWTPGWVVWVESAFLHVTQDMLIESVTYDLDNSGGSLARLALVDPRAYKGKKGKGNKSGKDWDQGSDAAKLSGDEN